MVTPREEKKQEINYPGKFLEAFFLERYEGWSGVSQFIDTGNRFNKMVKELAWPNDVVMEEASKCLVHIFPDNYNEMLTIGPSMVWALCPHHLLPCSFRVTMAYIPKMGSILGLSKFTRLAKIMGKRPIMQEQYSRELIDFLFDNLKPEGAGVHVVGLHGCMASRGVVQEVPVVTTFLKGSFLTDPAVKSEFLGQVDLVHKLRR